MKAFWIPFRFVAEAKCTLLFRRLGALCTTLSAQAFNRPTLIGLLQYRIFKALQSRRYHTNEACTVYVFSKGRFCVLSIGTEHNSMMVGHHAESHGHKHIGKSVCC
jgi:hypothetical protein